MKRLKGRSIGQLFRQAITADTLLKRLLIPYLLTVLFVAGSTAYNILSINLLVGRLNATYASNAQIFDLTQTVQAVLDDTERYLTTHSSNALANYYHDSEILTQKSGLLNDSILDSEPLLLQRNIRRMIDTYLVETQQAIAAKRGSDVEGYMKHYQNSLAIYQFIQENADRLNADFFQINYTEYTTMARLLNQIRSIDLFIMAVIIAINFAIVLLTAVRITRPIAALAQRANLVASGDINVQPITVESHDEVNILANAFKSMMVSLRDYVEQIRENLIHETQQKEHELIMENLLQVAQLKNLQAQINPHFLFNTLNTGVQLAMLEGADRTADLVEHIADFYRYNVKLFDHNVSLAEEVKMVQDYIYIQTVRFTDRVTYHLDIDPDCLDIRIPSLILQPLVENALLHGLKDAERDGRIELIINSVGPDVKIMIRDNGKGMKPEKIRQYLQTAAPDYSDHDDADPLSPAPAVPSPRHESPAPVAGTGIGLSNVISRLRLYYNRDDVIDIQTNADQPGTTILILIPRLISEPGTAKEG